MKVLQTIRNHPNTRKIYITLLTLFIVFGFFVFFGGFDLTSKPLDLEFNIYFTGSFLLLILGFIFVKKDWVSWLLMLVVFIPHLLLLYVFIALSELDILLALKVYFMYLFLWK